MIKIYDRHIVDLIYRNMNEPTHMEQIKLFKLFFPAMVMAFKNRVASR